MSKKLTYEFIKKQFEKENYKLLTKIYKNSKQKLKYICPKGHRHSINWSDWRQGIRCGICCTNNKRHTIDFVKSEFEKEGYKLLTKIYKNNRQKLDYICPKGHKHSISFNDWDNKKRRCFYCFGNVSPTTEFVKKEFEKEGYTLLSKYINSMKPLKFICPRGHKYFIRWNNWRIGSRCRVCSVEDKYCSGTWNWKGGTSNYCPMWTRKDFKESIKIRDGYKCLNPDCWKEKRTECGAQLSIHHINHDTEDCVGRNLITLCRSCNSRAEGGKDREWHEVWYKAIMYRRYNYV